MYKLIKLNLARNSLRYIIGAYNIKEIYIPYYLCDVVRQAVIKENCKPIFYHIDDNFYPLLNFPADAYILYPNYFGICDGNVDKLVNKYQNIIIDNAHSFYSQPVGLASFNSARKFFKVYNGSFLWIKKTLDMNFKVSAYKSAPQNQQETEYNEILFNSAAIEILSENIINEIEKSNDNDIRINQFLNLHEKYKDVNCLNIDISSVQYPFCYPYLASTADEANGLVKTLTNNGLTIYRYWNKLPYDFNEYKFYERLVAIPLFV